MFQRYSFVIFMVIALSATAWWAERFDVGEAAQASVEPFPSPDLSVSTQSEPQRRALLEVMDRIVEHEQFYRSVYGHYTKILNRLGVTVPANISDTYEIRVVEASAQGLLVSAIADSTGKTSDWASINQDFEVRSSFDPPAPTAE